MRLCCLPRVFAAVNFDCDVGQLRQLTELCFVVARFLGTIRYDRYDHRHMAGADPPQMQIRNPIPIEFESTADLLRQSGVRHRVEQNRTRAAE